MSAMSQAFFWISGLPKMNEDKNAEIEELTV